MLVNEVPTFDQTRNETGCCPRFDPRPWNEQELHFDNKPFVRATTTSLFHVPLNMRSVFGRTWKAIETAHANDGEFLVLSHDDSAWHAEHLFAVKTDVPGTEMVRLTGDFLTKVFEGPYSDARRWYGEMDRYVRGKGKRLERMYFFYTTCPGCAKRYGHNYVVGIARVA
jgi:hypothetical protein